MRTKKLKKEKAGRQKTNKAVRNTMRSVCAIRREEQGCTSKSEHNHNNNAGWRNEKEKKHTG